uniref:Uncharacterized protein n=1 Tax=Setaria digitata TaxID=48799 RepID=A0A915Q8E1_9BILA
MQTFDRFLPLNDFRKRTLATSKLRKSLLSIDTNNNLLILSSLDNRTDQLFVEQLALDDFQNGLTPKNIKLAGNMKNCQQLSSFVHCCVITAADNDSSADKGTHCFRQKITEFPDHFYEKNTQMIHTWQTFSNDETVVLLQNVAGDYSILDTKYGFSMPISENEDYVNLTPVAYFFGMDNAKELTELAQDDYKFYICEYLRDSEHRFLLQECYETAFRKMEKFSAVKFCANPIYQAVIQISEKMSTNLKWQLQVTYTATNDVIDDNVYTVDSTDLISNEQIAMICLPFSIDIYIVSNSVLVHYAVDLPKADGEALIGNYF